jgi:hypothetical protein
MSNYQTPVRRNAYTLPIIRRIEDKIRAQPLQRQIYVDKKEYQALIISIAGCPDYYYDAIPFGDYKIICKP